MKYIISLFSIILFFSCKKDSLPSDISTWNKLYYAEGFINNINWQPDSVVIKPTKDAPDLMDLYFIKTNEDKTIVEELNLFSISPNLNKNSLNPNISYPINPCLPRIEFRIKYSQDEEIIRYLYNMDNVVTDTSTNYIKLDDFNSSQGKVSGVINAVFYSNQLNYLELKDFQFSIGK